ncbi:MAG: hypothetical protein WBQ21_02345 [Solirubrobacteraceae bacterium]
MSVKRSLKLSKRSVNGFSVPQNRALQPLVTVVAVGLVAVALFALPAATRASEKFGIERIEQQAEEQGGAPATQAGSHPYELTTTLLFDRHALSSQQLAEGLGDAGPLGHEIADGDPKDVEVTLPAGMAVNLLAVQRCSEQQLARQECPVSSQVGDIAMESPVPAVYEAHESPVFNIAPSSPRVAGALGFTVANVGFIVHLVGSAHAGGDYGISGTGSGIPQIASADSITLTLWGDPSAPSHCHQQLTGGPCVAVARAVQPFLTLPTSCGSEPGEEGARRLSIAASADSWQEPGVWTPTLFSAPLQAMTGCGKLSFTPSIEVRPETTVAETPTGVSIALKIPQVEALGSLAEANLREAVVTLPANLVISPSAVSGLAGCSEAQVGLSSPMLAACPEASKVGTVQARTPLLNHPVEGSVYVAQQGNDGPAQGSNPFGSLIALYVVVEGSGVQIKAAGEVSLNQLTGQLTTRFRDLPELPYSEMTLNLFGGPRATLVPDACGLYTTSALLTPWSALDSNPPTPPAEAQSSFTVGSGCDTGGFAPAFMAGTTSNQAGGYSPFVTTFTRQDSEQGFAAIQEHIPTGLLGSIAHVPLCGEPQAREGMCGPESQVGTISVVVGQGTDPFQVPPGRVYLTGPYNGAPFGLSVVVPARGGPFDLGNVIVRAALEINPQTSAVTVATGPLPLMLQGVSALARSVTVEINRPEFIFNPTSCDPKAISATMDGAAGGLNTASVRFQATDCAVLAFKPRFSASSSAHTSRADGASLEAKLVYPPARPGTQANIAKVKVELPKQLPARLTTLQKACLARTFEANPASCPPASVVAAASATTPLLPVGLSGPAYFVSYGGAKFPELIVVLQGDGVTVYLHGETFISKSGITSSTFPAIPDVPVGSFELRFPQGPDSALAANGDLCTSKLTMPTEFLAQNGVRLTQNTKIAVTGCPPAHPQLARRKRKRRTTHAKSTLRWRTTHTAPADNLSTVTTQHNGG